MGGGGNDIIVGDTFDLDGDLTANDDIDLSTVTGTVTGAGAQQITAGTDGTGAVTTAGLTQNGGGNLTIGGQGAMGIDATGLIDVDTGAGTDDLIIVGNIRTNNTLRANGNIDFQGTGTSNFIGGDPQSVIAGDGNMGNITDTATTVLAKSDGDLILDAQGDIGSLANPVGVSITGFGFQAEAKLSSIHIISASALRIDRLQTVNANPDTIGITTTGSGNLVFAGGDAYQDILTDTVTLNVGGDLTFMTTLFDVGSITASFGEDTGAHAFTQSSAISVDTFVAVTGNAGADTFTLTGAITDGGGNSSTLNGGLADDTFDFADGIYWDDTNGGGDNDTLDFSAANVNGASTANLTFTSSVNGAGAIATTPGPTARGDYTGIERIQSGGGNDTLAGNFSYTLTGLDQGTASLLSGGAAFPSGGGPTWTSIENLVGTGAAGSNLNADVNYTINMPNAGTANNLTGGWSMIGTLNGNAATTDQFTLTGAGSLSGSIDGLDGAGDPDTLTGSTGYVVDTTDGGTALGIAMGFSNIENLVGTNGADSFGIDDGGLLNGTIRDNGGGSDTLTYGARTTGGAVTVNLQTGEASFINGGAASGFLIGEIDNFVGGGTDLDDTLVGPDQVAANTVQWTLDGGPSETVADAITQTFTGFEILQGGADVDDFNINASLTFSQIRGGAGADVFDLVDLAAPTTVGIDLMADIFGEAGNDQINFGVPRTPPVTPDTTGDRSQLVGTVDLGADNDTIDFSGAQQVGFMGSLISVSFIDVETIIGNNSAQLNGPVGDTDWLITDVGTGEYNTAGPDFGTGSGSTEFQNLSILGGPGIDRFFFGPNGVIPGGGTGQSVSITGVGPIGGQNGTILTGGANTGIDAGGGANVLVGSTAADTFTITGPNAVTIDVGVPAPSTLLNIRDIDGTLTSTFSAPNLNPIFAEAGDVGTDAGDDVFNLNVVTWAGFINGGLGSDTINIIAATNDTATITAIDPASLTSAVNNFTGVGGFTAIETLNTGLGDDIITLAAAPADPTVPARNQLNLGGGVDTITTALATDWLITGNGAGFVRDINDITMRVQFSGVDNLISTAGAPSNLTMPNVGPGGSISGAFTAVGVTLTPGAIFVGNTNDFRINAPVTAAGTTSITASGANDIDINGGLTLAAGNFTSSTSTGTAFYHDVYTVGNQTYSGPTEFAAGGLLELADGRTTARSLELATLRGADLTFNGPTNIVGQVLMESSTNRFDFDTAAGQVTSASDAVLGLLPTPATDLFFDLVPNMAGHINSNSFGAFQGTFCGGCEFLPNPTDPTDTFNGALTQVNADYIGIAEPFMTSGNIVMAGSVIEFAPTNVVTNVNLAAGNPGDGDVALIALGTQLQPASDGFGGVEPNGDIIAPAAQEVTITGGRALLASTNEIVNSEQILLQLGSPPGEILVTQGDAATNVVDFKIGSSADDSNTTDTDTLTILNSVAQLISTGAFAGFGAAGVSFSDITSAQQSIVSIFNPAAVLTLLQAISFLDASAFESELSLFGIIGEGIAQSLDQCEDAEGCAPSVTEEELAGFIDVLSDRISRLEGM